MGEIAAKLADALGMFWQALDDQERRLLLIGGVYLVTMVMATVSAKKRERRERLELVELIAQRIEAGRG